MSAERWLPIVGFEGRYEVSDLGRVRSLLPYRGTPIPRLISTNDRDPSGYPVVRLRRTNRTTGHFLLHRVVAAAFLGPTPEGMETRHLNGNKLDPRLVNLKYGTHAENMQDRLLHGTDPERRKTHCPQGHEYAGRNVLILDDGRRRRCRECFLAYQRRRYHRLRNGGEAA